MRRFSLAFLLVLALAGLLTPGTAGAEEILVAACPGPSGLSDGFGPSDDYGRLAQTFVPSLSDSLTRAEFDLVEPQGETRPYVVQILAVDGTGTPTDTLLAQTTTPDLPPGLRTLSATFASPAFVIAGQGYALALTRPVGGEWYWRFRELEAPDCPGQGFSQPGGPGGPWSESTYSDRTFRVFVGTPPSPPPTVSEPTPAPATCRGLPATVVGTEGNDVLSGNGNDVIVGLGGNDKLYGFGLNDLMCGGSGDDTLNGGKGTNTLYGETGNDLIIAGAGAGTRVGAGKAFGGSGNDTLRGGKGNNKLYGQVGKDSLSGGSHHDKLNGGPGKDLCNGGKGNDTAAKCEVEKSI